MLSPDVQISVGKRLICFTQFCSLGLLVGLDTKDISEPILVPLRGIMVEKRSFFLARIYRVSTRIQDMQSMSHFTISSDESHHHFSRCSYSTPRKRIQYIVCLLLHYTLRCAGVAQWKSFMPFVSSTESRGTCAQAIQNENEIHFLFVQTSERWGNKYS